MHNDTCFGVYFCRHATQELASVISDNEEGDLFILQAHIGISSATAKTGKTWNSLWIQKKKKKKGGGKESK